MNHRWIELQGAANVRDLGGLPTTDGGQTVPRRLLRADNLQDLSPSDLTTLVTDIRVTTVVDLRSTGELRSEGPAPLDSVPGVRHVHRPVLPESGLSTDAAADALLVRSQRNNDWYPADPICGHYLGYLEDRPDQFVAALRDIATSLGATMVHCAAGKDRTGVLVALALRAVGVRPEAVVADYVATGERIAAVLDRLRRSPTYCDDVNSKSVDSQRPRPETMAMFLGEIDSQHGGVVRWLAARGFSDEDLRRLRARLRDVGGAVPA